MTDFQPNQYGPVLAQLIDIDRCRALDQGSPASSIQGELSSLNVAEAFAHTQLADQDMARCCLSGVWLLHDFLDDSHTISQGISTAEGSFWHGIMHRREGDFSNSKYWFRKVGHHPVFEQIANANALDNWDPFDFVDECQTAIRSGEEAQQLCRELQQSEWELLFDYCYQNACG